MTNLPWGSCKLRLPWLLMPRKHLSNQHTTLKGMAHALALTTYEDVCKLFAVISAKCHSSCEETLSRNSIHENQLMAYGCNCIWLLLFELKNLKPVLNAFMAARYFFPSKMSELKLTASDLDQLACSLPIFEAQAELPSVLAVCKGVHPSVNPTDQIGGNHTENNLVPG